MWWVAATQLSGSRCWPKEGMKGCINEVTHHESPIPEEP